jgi:hypothetical protein
MWRCVAFLAAAVVMCGLDARADYLYVKIDLSQVYQNMPSLADVGGQLPFTPVGPQAGPGRGGPGRGYSRGGPVSALPIPNPANPNPQPKSTPGDGPFVYAVVEVRSKKVFEWAGKKDPDGVKNGAYQLDHTWGKKGYFISTPALTPGIIKYVDIHKESLAAEYGRIKKELVGATDPQKFVNAAMWALQHGWSRKPEEPGVKEIGLMREFYAAMDELKKLDPKHPVAVNYVRVQNGLKKPPSAEDPAARNLAEELTKTDPGRFHKVNGTSGFYVALTNQQGNFDIDTKRRLNRLYETMESFYYWFALNPNLPQPAFPQYVQTLVVIGAPDDFYAKHALWDAPPFIGDGMTPRRDNVILLSARPLDDVYHVFSGNNQEFSKKMQILPDWLIKGSLWEGEKAKSLVGRDPLSVAFVQTLTIVQKAIEEDAEISTLTREGTRQLLFASGILPRQVHTPEWVSQGLASYFETPTGAPYRGVGLPSWSNLVALTYFKINKKLDRPADVLANVITDRYFRNAQKLINDAADMTDREKINERIDEEIDLGTSTAWALAYYLIERRRQPQLLMRYCQELNALPRDLELSDRAMEACFAKVFDMADPSNPSRVDPAKFSAFAAAWFTEIAGVSLEVPEVRNEYLDLRKAAAVKKPPAN